MGVSADHTPEASRGRIDVQQAKVVDQVKTVRASLDNGRFRQRSWPSLPVHVSADRFHGRNPRQLSENVPFADVAGM